MNRFKSRLSTGPAQMGSFASLGSTATAEALACHGFDFVLVDLEHAPNDISNTVGLLQAVQAGDADGVLRVPWNDAVWIKRALDIGAKTLMIPMVQSAEEARAAVRAMRYPPAGIRGVAAITRASGYGVETDYLARANAEVCLIAQAETAEAVALIPEIAAVDGVDAVFIGPSDLAASMGFLGKTQAPEVRAKIAEGLALGKKSGIPMGVLGVSPAECAAFAKDGFDFVLLATDTGIFIRQLRADIAALKEGGWAPRPRA